MHGRMPPQSNLRDQIVNDLRDVADQWWVVGFSSQTFLYSFIIVIIILTGAWKKSRYER